MKVLYLTVGAEIGGGSTSLHTLMEKLRTHGVQSTVICPRTGPLFDKYARIGVPCREMSYDWLERDRPWRSMRQFARWRRIVKEIAPDVVHANALGAARSVGLPAWSARIPWICHCRFPVSRAYFRWLFRRLPKPQVFVSCSHGLHTLIADSISEVCPRARQEVVYDAVDLEAFTPRPKPAGAPLRVGIVANLTPVKGHEVFLNMARIVVDRGLEPEFWLVGRDKDCGDEVRALVQSLNLANYVHLLGYRSDIPDILANLDVVVSSSHMECCPVNVIEAMACCRPVVVTRVGGSPELVDDGTTGLVVPPKDPCAMADAVARLLRSESTRTHMGLAGRERAERMFGQQGYATKIMSIYESILHARPSDGVLTHCDATPWAEHVGATL